MSPNEQTALLNILVQAALCDGDKSDQERQFIRQLSSQLDAETGGARLAQAVQDALLRRVSVAQAASQLTDSHHRQLAYEWAVAVCDTDGLTSTAERAFLSELRVALQLGTSTEAQAAEAQVHAVAAAAYSAHTASDMPSGTPRSAQPGAPADSLSASGTRPSPDQAALDKMVLNYAILNGALELLPQSWASMAIIPLQIKMVYRIGKAHGVELDQGHIREFIAAAGIGLTSQYLEQFGRKLLGGLVGKAAGKMLGGIAGAATGMAFSFATTYALGQLAQRYYAGGRVMSTDVLRQTYQQLMPAAKGLQQQHWHDIQARARTLNAGEVMQMVRG